MQSRDLIEKLVSKLDLTEDPNFNTALLPPEEATFSLSATIRQVIDLIRGDKDQGAEETVPLTEQEILEDVVDQVRGSIEISNLRDKNKKAHHDYEPCLNIGKRIARNLCQTSL